MNRVILVGNLGRDPEVKGAVVILRLATTEYGVTSWHRVVLFKKNGEYAQKFLKKGSCVCVEGRLCYREYEKDGQKLVMSEIIADSISSVGGRKETPETKPAPKEIDPECAALEAEIKRQFQNADSDEFF